MSMYLTRTKLRTLFGDGTAILHGHPSYAKGKPLQGKGITVISQLLQETEYWSRPGNQTRDLPLCSQALYRLSCSPATPAAVKK